MEIFQEEPAHTCCHALAIIGLTHMNLNCICCKPGSRKQIMPFLSTTDVALDHSEHAAPNQLQVSFLPGQYGQLYRASPLLGILDPRLVLLIAAAKKLCCVSLPILSNSVRNHFPAPNPLVYQMPPHKALQTRIPSGDSFHYPCKTS